MSADRAVTNVQALVIFMNRQEIGILVCTSGRFQRLEFRSGLSCDGRIPCAQPVLPDGA